MYLLDTTIVSLFDPRRRAEAEPVIAWIRQHDPLLFISTMTLTEIEAGILKLVRENKQARADQLITLRDGLIADYQDRLLRMDVDVALAVARLAEAVQPMVVERADLIIAATAKVHSLTILTRNVRHFAPTGVPVINTMTALPTSERYTGSG